MQPIPAHVWQTVPDPKGSTSGCFGCIFRRNTYGNVCSKMPCGTFGYRDKVAVLLQKV